MNRFSQAHRPMRLTIPALAGKQTLLASFDGREAISQLFRFTLDVRVPIAEGIEFDQVLGQQAGVDAIGPEPGPIRRFRGIIATAGETFRDKSFVHLEIEMVPNLWLLTQTRQSRIFQNLTVGEIVEKVFVEHSIRFRTQFNESYPKRNCTTQYDESDFAFASRLLEDHGIHYWFEHEEHGDRVVLSDLSLTAPRAFDRPIRFQPTVGNLEQEYRVRRWRSSVTLRPGKFIARDHSFRLPNKTLESSEDLASAAAVGQRTLTTAANRNLVHYEYPGDYAKLFDVDADIDGLIASQKAKTIKIRAQEQACQGFQIRGESDCPIFTSGQKFALAGHANDDGDYLITTVEHHLRMPEYRADDDQASTEYKNVFECLPAAVPFRPARLTPTPYVRGSQTATVVGTTKQDGDIAVDKHGRIRVHFHWDRDGQSDGGDSCWIRVASSWAGKGWGMMSLPRIGQEVVVDFVNGDPDQPLVIGSVYNPEQTTPSELPNNRNEMSIKSRTVGGSSGDFHGLSMDDTNGSELFRLRSQRDMLVEVKNDHQMFVPNLRSTVVGSSTYDQAGALISVSSTNDVGSGSGGGTATDAGATTDTSAGSSSGLTWTGISVSPTLTYRNMATYGVSFMGTAGMSSMNTAGISQMVTIAPGGLLGNIGRLGSVAAGLQAALGSSIVTYGGSTMMTYGPSVMISRGGGKQIVGPYPDSGSAIIKSLAVVHACSSLANIIIPAVTVNSSETLRNGLNVAANVLETVMLAILAGVEDKYYKVAAAKKEQAELKLQQEALEEESKRKAVKTQAASARADLLAALSANALQWSDGDEAEGRKIHVAGNYANVVDKAYSMNAADGINLRSAQNIFLSGEKTIALEASQNVGVFCSSTEGLMLYSAPVPVDPPAESFENSLELETLGTKLTAKSDSVTSTVTMNKDGIQFEAKFADMTSSIKLTSTGIIIEAPSITLKDADGTHQVECKSEGIAIAGKKVTLQDTAGTNSIVADANQIELTGVDVKVTLDAGFSIKASKYAYD